jgi:hypothetical protein
MSHLQWQFQKHVPVMDSSSSNRSESWEGQPPDDQGASNDASWGEGSASALESLKKREQRRDHSHPRHDEEQHPQLGGSNGA